MVSISTKDPSYWWSLVKKAEHVDDLSHIVQIFLRFAPTGRKYIPAYFAALGIILPRLRWREALVLYEKLYSYSPFWDYFSRYIGNRADRRAYFLILDHLDDPLFRPYLWRTVQEYVSRDGYRSPELLIALSRYASDSHYWRALKRYLRKYPSLASYVLLRIPSGSRHYVLTALSLAKSFPRHLYPVIRELVRSGEHSRVFLDALASFHRRYPHIYSDLLPTCPNCGHEMFFDGSRFVCPECEYNSDVDPESGTFR